MALTVRDLAQAVRRGRKAMVELEQPLNEADSRMGDGDTGGMLARLLAGLDQAPITDEDLGASFAAYAKAALTATGSSLGTLVATALFAMSRETKGRPDLPWGDLGALLHSGCEAMLDRGQSALGDKTVADALHAVAGALDGEADPQRMAMAAVQATEAALARFRDEPCRSGRARMFGDASRGLDDPGMLAFAWLARAVTSPP